MVRQKLAVLGHKGQLHESNGGVGTLVVANLGLDVAETHFVVEALAGGLKLHLIQHDVAKSEDFHVGDILFHHLASLVALGGHLFKKGFRGRVEVASGI